MTGSQIRKWLRNLFGHTPTEHPETNADEKNSERFGSRMESERPEPHTESELAVKAPIEDVPDVSDDESGRTK